MNTAHTVVLLVEDNPHDQFAVRRTLERSRKRFELIVRERAEELPAAIDDVALPIDIVLLDYDLPGDNGLEAFQRLTLQPDSPPFIMLTGAGSENVAVDALKAGMADYLVKDPDQGYLRLLPLKIKAALRQRRETLARIKAQADLERAHAELERLVAERTAELQRTVTDLSVEVAERRESERALRRSQRDLRRLSESVVDIQESERRQVAKELHDSIGSSLAAIKFAIEAKLGRMEGAAPDTDISLEKIIAYIHGTMDEVRRISAYLRPTILDDTGLLATIEWFCASCQELYGHTRIETRLEITEAQIPEAFKVVIFRVLQEAVNNAFKHSGADLATVHLASTAGGGIRLRVTDTGCGFDPAKVRPEGRLMGGQGLLAMHERSALIGGTFTLTSTPGQGTRICLELPPAGGTADETVSDV